MSSLSIFEINDDANNFPNQIRNKRAQQNSLSIHKEPVASVVTFFINTVSFYIKLLEREREREREVEEYENKMGNNTGENDQGRMR